MLISIEQFRALAHEIDALGGDVGVDFETTGLNPYKGDRAFLLGFTDTAGVRYSVKLDSSLECLRAMHLFFSSASVTYCAHNAKFELGFLSEQFGIEVKGRVWDTEVNARIERNSHMAYSLQACAERIGESKHKPLLDWLKQRGNKNAYHKAPDDLIVPYVEQDAWLSWKLRQHQVEIFKHWDASSPHKIKSVVNLERAVLPHLFNMEQNGLLVDVGYCKRAIAYEQTVIERAKADFKTHAQVPFVDSRKTLQPVFDSAGIHYGQTALGNASFTEDALRSHRGHPVVAAILTHRRALKRVSAYWSNFLDLEHNGIIHPSIHQNKAATGRMSISDPSAQNWPVDGDDDHFPVRRAFIARPECVIASLDYAQIELRKAADEAEDYPMIERIQSGADLHQEIADIAGVSRSLAKNGRFAFQYGAGIPRIATTLGVTEDVARSIVAALTQQAAGIAAYSRALQRSARPFGIDWLGRRFYFDPGFEFKALNYRIQGGCAEILKIAVCDVGEFLGRVPHHEDTFMLVVIHDEICLSLHKNDLHLLPEIKRLMIAAHRDKKVLSMDVNVSIGANMHDLEEHRC